MLIEPSIRIALIGDRGSGKTSFLSGLYAKHCTPQSYPVYREEAIIQRIREENWQHLVNFFVEDIIMQHDRELLKKCANGLRARPEMQFPERSDISDFFPMRVKFMGRNFVSNNVVEFSKKLALIDIPGGHIDPEYEDQVRRRETVDLLLGAEAFIVFIDTTKVQDFKTGHYERIVAEIGNIVQRATESNVEFAQKFIPVTIVFSKSDSIATADMPVACERMFRRFAVDISERSPHIIAMSCPVSICSRERLKFEAFNLHFPFLFSALGIVFAQHLSKDAASKKLNITSESTFIDRLRFYFSQRVQYIEALKGSDMDRLLAHMIYENMCIEELVRENFIHFAHDGNEISLPQIGVRP